MRKTAFITGITGQDGSFLAEFLLNKDYQVVGLVSDKHGIGEGNIANFKDRLILEPGDLLDKSSLKKIIDQYQPQEIYNLAGISFVPTGWEKPELTFNVNCLGLARILEIIRKDYPQTKLFQASSAKMFGNPDLDIANEETPLQPKDIYATSKTAAHFLINNFRNHFQLFVCSAIMFNHESERRGIEFVTRKITHGAAQIKLDLTNQLALGNLDSQADWGYAPDYIKAMWLMLQQDQPEDFVLATGELHSIREVCQIAFEALDLDYKKFVKIDKRFYKKDPGRSLTGNSAKAKKVLNWQPKTDFKQMITKMVDYDLNLLKEKK